MKKRIFSWTLLIAMMISMLSLAGCSTDGAKVAANSRNGVVRIIALQDDLDGLIDAGANLGSAFGIGKVGEETDTFITNRHVLYNTYELEDGSQLEVPVLKVWIMKNTSAWDPVTGLDTSLCIPCEIIYVEEDGFPDMAILKAAEPVTGRVALPLMSNDSKLEVGDDVFALGYPSSSDFTEQNIHGKKWLAGVEDATLTEGSVSRFTTSSTWGNTRLIQHTAQINHGNSGGPLLNEKGVVVGINTYGFGQNFLTGDDNSYASVRISHIIKILDELDIYYETDEDLFNPLVIVAAAVAVIAIAAIVGIVIFKKRPAPAPAPAPAPTPIQPTAPAAAPTMAVDTRPRLQCLSGTFAGQRFSIDGSVRIGRDPARNDLLFPTNAEGISGVHCVVSVEGDTIWLKDLGSTYGTYLASGQRLAANEAVKVKIGDKFWLGSEKEVFVIAPKGGI